MEKEDWKPFRNALDKKDRKKFDEMFDIPRLYTSACSYAVQPVRLYPILMSILHHFKELTQCVPEVERIESIVKSKNKGEELLTKEKEEEEEAYLDCKIRFTLMVVSRPMIKAARAEASAT